MRRTCLGAGLILLYMLAAMACAEARASAAAPRADIEERTDYYRVDDTSAKGLRRQMAERGPRDGKGRPTSGLTTQTFEARYRVQPIPGTKGYCRLEGIKVHLSQVTVLPEWQPKRRPSEGLRQRWEHMQRALALHEEGHRANGRWAAEHWQQRLLALGPGDCLSLEMQAQGLRAEVLDALTQREDEYDQRTRFGLDQLPLPDDDELLESLRRRYEERLQENLRQL